MYFVDWAGHGPAVRTRTFRLRADPSHDVGPSIPITRYFVQPPVGMRDAPPAGCPDTSGCPDTNGRRLFHNQGGMDTFVAEKQQAFREVRAEVER